ncbi:hypothetical protein ABK040_015225 [Willaertia magna]
MLANNMEDVVNHKEIEQQQDELIYGNWGPENTHICVTGVSGFIASQIVLDLLEKGYTVHGTVRSIEKHKPILEDVLIKASTSGKITKEYLEQHFLLFEADLLREGSFKEAIQGCQFVLHTASPYRFSVKNPQTDLVDPAVNGTLNVLRECINLRSTQQTTDVTRLRRIILTSSIAAIFDKAEIGKVYTEDDWNEGSSLTHNPYMFSKVSAEKAAWNLLKEAEEKYGKDFLEMAVINPAAVIGPCIIPGLINQSHDFLIKIGNGEFPAIFNLGFPFVDVRDVSTAHYLAMVSKESFLPSKKERFIVCAETVAMSDLCDYLRNTFPNPPHAWAKRIPKTKLTGKFGNGLAYLAAFMHDKGVRQAFQGTIGRPPYFNIQKVTTKLGLKQMDCRQSVKETVEWLFASGVIKK